ncbi:MAG TPA: sulfite exporter TauE/SafE family protein [Gemmatimonadaceae bacterium]
MIYVLIIAVGSVLAGAIASVVGFGIGSVLTPLFAVRVGTQLAVAAVSIPHLLATALRFWRLRASVDRRVLLSFGITSAAGGLVGALLHSYASNRSLAIVFGLLLLFVGISELTGFARRMRFGGPVAWVAGGISGVFGGLVGNQGGIRSAALLGFDLDRQAFVATATAIGLVVDGARMPVYFATQTAAIARIWPLVLIATLGTLAGTVLGVRTLRRIPEPAFRRIVAILLLLLGTYMLLRG